MLAPIALFTYKRLDHTKRTVESLAQNELASDSDLMIFSDAAKTVEDAQAVNHVREYLSKISGFRSVRICCREQNFGLAKSVITGVTDILSEHDTVIVLEDDMLTSPLFLQYMNGALVKFATDKEVISIHGYMYPVKTALPDAFFIRGADCWGWATWSRGWNHFNPNGQLLLDKLIERGLTKDFDFSHSYPYLKMLKDQIEGLNDSWAIRWYASAFLANKLTLYPGISLVQNIGNDGSGIHSKASKYLDVDLNDTNINLSNIPLFENKQGRLAIETFFKNLLVDLA